MSAMYTLPQEIEVWYVIPAIRRELAILLTRKHGLSYDKAGKALGISKAAVSQYHNNKRASKIKLHSQVLEEVERASDAIATDNDVTAEQIQRVLLFMRERKLPFEICENDADCKEAHMIYSRYLRG